MSIVRIGAGLALFLFITHPSAAEIFRCQRPSGEVVFQATRCAATQAAPLTLRPLNVLGERLRPGEHALLADQASRERRPSRTKPDKSSRTQRRRSAERCLARQQKLAAVGAKLRRGYKPAQGERLRRKRDEHAEYVRRFCD